MINLKDKKVIVTGGAGFLGKFVVKKLKDRNCKDIFIPKIEEYDLRNLEKIRQIIGFKGKVVWDITKPYGQPRRCLDTTKAEKEFGFKAKVKFDEGLKKAIDWYIENKDLLKI